MSRLVAMLPLLAAFLAACTAGDPGASAPSAGDALGDRTTLEWQGRLACADCVAIEQQLQLQRDGDVQRYQLVEVFLAQGGEARFDERGQWRQQGARLQLQAMDGAQRHYRLLADGRLQPADRHGHVPPDGAGGVLLPVTVAPAP